MNPTEFIDKLKACGWWNALTQSARENLTNNYTAQSQAQIIDLAEFIFDTEFDGQGPYDGDLSQPFMPDSYHQVIQLYAQQSRGLFTPTSIQETFNSMDSSLTLSFAFRGELFQITVPRKDDWFRKDVHDLINSALEKYGIPQRFYWLPVYDQMVYAVFLEPHIYQAAKDIGLIPTKPVIVEYEMPDSDEDLSAE